MSRTSQRKKTAEELCVLYHEAVRAEVATLTKGGRVMKSRTLDDVDKAARRAFLAAADACIELEVDPREFVVAQFSKWRETSSYHKKFMMPSPHHMGTLAARVRYLQFKASQEIRVSRVVTIEEQEDRKRFFVEERKLRGMARMQRRDPVDVLAEQPEEFSRDFLKHKNVWNAVSDLWEERRR